MASNFGFVRTEGPELFDECARAERYARADPRVACIYARRALEQLVAFVHDVAGLPAPYRNDLDAKLSAPDFRNLTGQIVAAKCNLIRKVGNMGARLPSGLRFDPALVGAPQGSKPLTKAELGELLGRFRRQDEQVARAKARRTARRAHRGGAARYGAIPQPDRARLRAGRRRAGGGDPEDPAGRPRPVPRRARRSGAD